MAGTDDKPLSDDEVSRVRSAVDLGAQTIGAAAGAAVGLAATPEAMIGGAAAGPIISRAVLSAGASALNRVMARRSEGRIGFALATVMLDAEARLADGHSVRRDDFFTPNEAGRSPADEVLEGMLTHAADTYEEPKLRHLAAIFPTAATDETLRPSSANWVTRTVHDLSWRQLIVLGAVDARRPQHDRDPARGLDYPGLPADLDPTLREELHDLGTRGLLGRTHGRTEAVRSDASIVQQPSSIWQLTDTGKLIARAARLDLIPPTDRELLADALLLNVQHPPRRIPQ